MPASFANQGRGLKELPAIHALAWTAGIITAICLAFEPCWETNDDVAMSMIAHGYGLAAYGSPYLVVPNVLWGYLVRSIPSVNGVLGYSIATLAILLAVGGATLYFLLRLGAGYITGLLAVALIIAQPTLFPQLTKNAGLLTAAAIIGWQVYARFGGVGNLVIACIFAFLGYLIRDKEFLLVLGVALPLLPWRALRERRQMQVAFLLLGIAIASAAAFNRWSYNGPEWSHFQGMDPNRSPITNFVNYGADWYLQQHPEIIARHGYSKNDVALIGNWFFVDPQIADLKSLEALLTELGPIPMQENSVQSGIAALKTLADPMLLPLVLPALLLLVLAPSRKVMFAWVLCLAALFTIGVMGRPGQFRVYVPLVCLLFVAPHMFGGCKENIRQKIAALTLFAACVGNAYVLIPRALEVKQLIREAQMDISRLPAEPIFSWAQSFPFEFVFPVLANNPSSRNIRLYGLDSFTHAPFSVAAAEQAAGRGMVKRLQTEAGIPVVASQERLELLRVYCRERLYGQLRGLAKQRLLSMVVYQVRCESPFR